MCLDCAHQLMSVPSDECSGSCSQNTALKPRAADKAPFPDALFSPSQFQHLVRQTRRRCLLCPHYGGSCDSEFRSF